MKLTRHILRLLLLIINIAAVICLLLANLGQFIRPTLLSLPSLFGIGYEWIVACNIICALLWLFTERKSRTLISLTALLLSWIPISHTIGFSRKEAAGTGKQLRIVSYNTQRLDYCQKPGKNKVLQYIQEQDADIVCLQEFETNKNPQFITLQEVKQYLTHYPYSYIDYKIYKKKRQYGLAVFSKYPLLNKQTLHYESQTNISDRCDVVVGTDTFRLFNNHLQSNRLTQQDLSLSVSGTEELSTELKQTANTIGHKLIDAYRYRADQAQYIRQEICESPYPVIVCGDMNDVPVSYVYRTLSKGLKDSFLESTSWQTGHTLYKKGLGVRIDYILCSPQFYPADFRIDKVDYSDHYPISCVLQY